MEHCSARRLTRHLVRWVGGRGTAVRVNEFDNPPSFKRTATAGPLALTRVRNTSRQEEKKTENIHDLIPLGPLEGETKLKECVSLRFT